MKLGTLVHHHDPECHAKSLGSCLQGQGRSSAGSNPEKITFFYISLTFEPFATKHCIVSPHHAPLCLPQQVVCYLLCCDRQVLEVMAAARGEDAEQLASIMHDNTMKLFFNKS